MGIRMAAACAAMAMSSSAMATSDPATPAQDLDCAIWASVIAGTTADKEILAGLAGVLGYFVGRYEGGTAQDIDEAMLSRTPQVSQAPIERLQPLCHARMMQYGQRLIGLGKRMQTMGAARSAN